MTATDVLPDAGAGPRPEAAPRSVKPFQGSVRSCAFPVRDAEAFENDPGIEALSLVLDVPEVLPPEGAAPQSDYCLVRDFRPEVPITWERDYGLVLMGDLALWQAGIDDARGWIAALQRHLDSRHALLVEEYLNPGAVGFDLLWIILPEVAVCALRPSGEGYFTAADGGADDVQGGRED